MTSPPRLPAEQWEQVVRLAPLVSIDLVCKDLEGRYLIGLRNNEPARDMWFVPGGCIRKGERLDEAFERLTRTELGHPYLRSQSRLLGIYEHHYRTNFTGGDDFATHYVVLAHELTVTDEPVMDDQHRKLRWASPAEILGDPKVHANTQAYFQND